MRKGRGTLRNKSSRQVAELLRHYRYSLERPGPHERWVRYEGETPRYAFVPAGRAAIAPKTLLSILEQAGISKEEARRFWHEK